MRTDLPRLNRDCSFEKMRIVVDVKEKSSHIGFVALQRRPVSHMPDMAEGISEGPLTVDAARYEVFQYTFGPVNLTRCDGPSYEVVRFVDEDLHASDCLFDDGGTGKLGLDDLV